MFVLVKKTMAISFGMSKILFELPRYFTSPFEKNDSCVRIETAVLSDPELKK